METKAGDCAELFQLSADWGQLAENGQIVPFGIGRIGRRVIPALMREFHVPFLVDNSHRTEKLYDLKVLDIVQAAPLLHGKNCKIVVTTMNRSYAEISRELEASGFRENIDFCLFERFVEEWNLRWKNRCVLSKIDTVITSRCTLRCKNCNLFIGYVSEPHDIATEALQRNFDIFFDSIDYVYEYTLLGGEPFLHAGLDQLISYLGEQYGNRIGQINLISNGTVIPEKALVNTLKKYQVMVNISDYTHSVDYSKRLKELISLFTAEGIDYYVIPNNTWKDVIYPRTTYHTEDPRKHMLLCGHSTHSVANGKLYWCDPAFAAECFMGFQAAADDSLDLAENRRKYSKYDAMLNIMRYLLGNVNERGFMTICEKCAGVGRDNHNVVTAGLQ